MDKLKNLDSLDKKIIRYLGENGRMSVKELIQKLGITSPTLHSRIKQLNQSGVLKIAGLIDPFKMSDLIMALVAVKIDDDTKLDEKLEQISQMEEVHCAYVVTGRYDIFIEVIFTGGMESHYHFMSKKLPELGNIRDTESFVIMKSKEKWVRLPPKPETYSD